MKEFIVTGMSCAACQAKIEKCVDKVPGVTMCSVSLLTNTMLVDGSFYDTDVINAVVKAGYGASVKSSDNDIYDDDRALKEDYQKSKKKLLISAILLVILMYISMLCVRFRLPLFEVFEENSVALGITECIISLSILVINKKFFISGFRGIRSLSPNMDSLVALGSLISFLWSVYVLVVNIVNSVNVFNNINGVNIQSFNNHYYFDSAAMILVMVSIGKMLESRSKEKTTDAIKTLIGLRPKTANLIVDNEEKTVDIGSLKVGDVFVVRAGESIPADGVIIEGFAAVNDSCLTGESIPKDKKTGDYVNAATINQDGYIKCIARKVGENTTLSQIIKIVTLASTTKAPIARIADRVAGIFVPLVMGISLITFAVWLIISGSFEYSIARAVSVLVISCPCSLGLATPVAIMAGNGIAAKNGILFKSAVSLEQTGRVQIAVLDKTGTVTQGVPEVKHVECLDEPSVVLSEIPFASPSETSYLRSLSSESQDYSDRLLKVACSLEKLSEHPLGKAIVAEGIRNNVSVCEVENFKVYPGGGVEGTIDGTKYRIGKLEFVSKNTGTVTKQNNQMNKVYQANTMNQMDQMNHVYRVDSIEKFDYCTRVYLADTVKVLGCIYIADTVKPQSKDAIDCLRKAGVHTILLTGDDSRVGEAIRKETGIDYVISDVYPQDKDMVISKLKELGTTIMVGDGINDSPALVSADVGIAVGNGTDVAIDSADVIINSGALTDVVKAVSISRKTVQIIKENLFWAFFYNIICIPLAAGCYSRLLDFDINPMVCATAMSISSIFVVLNALRLYLFNADDYSNIEHESKASQSERTIRTNCISKRSNLISEDEIRSCLSMTEDELNKTKLARQMEDRRVTKIFNVEGMMCMHCEARVQKTLEAIAGIEKAIANHEDGTVTVELSKEISDDVIVKAITDAGYEVK